MEGKRERERDRWEVGGKVFLNNSSFPFVFFRPALGFHIRLTLLEELVFSWNYTLLKSLSFFFSYAFLLMLKGNRKTKIGKTQTQNGLHDFVFAGR